MSLSQRRVHKKYRRLSSNVRAIIEEVESFTRHGTDKKITNFTRFSQNLNKVPKEQNLILKKKKKLNKMSKITERNTVEKPLLKVDKT